VVESCSSREMSASSCLTARRIQKPSRWHPIANGRGALELSGTRSLSIFNTDLLTFERVAANRVA